MTSMRERLGLIRGTTLASLPSRILVLCVSVSVDCVAKSQKVSLLAEKDDAVFIIIIIIPAVLGAVERRSS